MNGKWQENVRPLAGAVEGVEVGTPDGAMVGLLGPVWGPVEADAVTVREVALAVWLGTPDEVGPGAHAMRAIAATNGTVRLMHALTPKRGWRYTFEQSCAQLVLRWHKYGKKEPCRYSMVLAQGVEP
jgi:hypothetical protein